MPKGIAKKSCSILTEISLGETPTTTRSAGTSLLARISLREIVIQSGAGPSSPVDDSYKFLKDVHRLK